MSKDKIQKAIAEYEQANELVRQYIIIGWTIGAIFLPVSIGLIAFSFTIDDITRNELIIFALSSILTYSFWLLFSLRFRWYIKIIFERIRELEEILSMDLHSRIHQLDEEKCGKKSIKSWSIAYAGLGSLIIIWIFRIFVFPI